jgi:hypothetical protein
MSSTVFSDDDTRKEGADAAASVRLMWRRFGADASHSSLREQSPIGLGSGAAAPRPF